MHQRTAAKRQQRLWTFRFRIFRRPITPILTFGAFHRLLKFAFELQRGGRDAIDKQHQIQPGVVFALAMMRRVRDFLDHAHSIGPEAGLGLRVHAVVGLETAKRYPGGRHLEAMAQHVQRALSLQLAHRRVEQCLFRVGGVLAGEPLPLVGMSFPEVVDQILRIQCPRSVIASSRPRLPANVLGAHRVDDVLLEWFFAAIGHCLPLILRGFYCYTPAVAFLAIQGYTFRPRP